MESDHRADGNYEHSATAAQPRSRLFAVRLWKEEVRGGAEYRGTVRDVMGGVFVHFRHWPELEAFMGGRIEEDEETPTGLWDDGR